MPLHKRTFRETQELAEKMQRGNISKNDGKDDVLNKQTKLLPTFIVNHPWNIWQPKWKENVAVLYNFMLEGEL